MKSEIDPHIASRVAALNRKGFQTIFSCSGMPGDHDQAYMDEAHSHGLEIHKTAYLAFKPDDRLVDVSGWIKEYKQLASGPAVIYYVDRGIYDSSGLSKENLVKLADAWRRLFSALSINKIAWPWIGTTQHEMGSMTDAFQDVDQAPYEKYDSMVPEKSLYEGAPPSMDYSESRLSPVDGDGEDMVLMADDEDDEEGTIVTVYDKEEKLASFKCDIAKTFQEKVNGLQVYSSLSNDSGLLFEYNHPQDLLYHMGTVNFPIDIIFLDKDKKIKRIYSNIQPGTLATFGCANSQYVLEVSGGTSENLGLKAGDNIKVKKGRNTLKKSASLHRSSPKMVYVYNFDGLIDKNPYIKISKAEEYDEDNITLRYDGEVFTPGSTIVVKASNMNKHDGFYFSKTNNGLYGFLENSEEMHQIHQDMKYALSKEDNLIVFATSHESPVEISRAFISKLETLYGELPKREKVVCKISSDYNHLNIIEDMRAVYPESKIRLFADDELQKKAGTPIPSSVKEQSKEAVKSLSFAKKQLEKSVNNLKQNLVEYEKIRNEETKIKGSQGQFNQSIKRNVEVAKHYLLAIRDAIRVLNKIKDATTTMEIIEALASSSKRCSEDIQEVFDLINKMNTPDFVMLLTEATSNYEKSAEDLEASIHRAKEYINRNILGIIVLST